MCIRDSDTHRRAVNTQTTVQESRHRLARKIFHGNRGALYQRYREGQEDQLGVLGIVLNAATLWNTRYVDAAVSTGLLRSKRSTMICAVVDVTVHSMRPHSSAAVPTSVPVNGHRSTSQ